MIQFFLKFVRFGIVGTVGTFIDFAITFMLLYFFGMGDYLTQSVDHIVKGDSFGEVAVVLFVNAIGFVVAATSNYFFNRVWTWKSSNPDVRQEYGKFFKVSLIGLIINLLVIYGMERFGSYEFTMFGYLVTSFMVSKGIATVVVMLWNFLVNNFYTFRGVESVEELKE